MIFAIKLAPMGAALVAVAGIVLLTSAGGSQAAGTNPDAVSIDMDPALTPANTATSLGSLQGCARINENDILDADEDAAADTLNVDVTVTNIPESNPMIAYSYVLNYSEAALSLQTADHNFLLAANGLEPFNGSNPLPDNDGNDLWIGTMVDTGASAAEFGSGVLSRKTISSDSGAGAGRYPLTLTNAAIIDPGNEAHPADVRQFGAIAVGQECSVLPPKQGDVDCSSTVDAIDALKVLRHVAGLEVAQSEPCDNIGTGITPIQMGNVDCSMDGSVVTTIDALEILRFVAGLPFVQDPSCPQIGT